MISTLICAALGQELSNAKFHSRAEFYSLLQKVEVGMTQSQVRDLIGLPDFVDQNFRDLLLFTPNFSRWKYGSKSSSDLAELGWIGFADGKVVQKSKVIYSESTEKIISERELRNALRFVYKRSQGNIEDVFELREYFRKLGVRKTKAVLKTYVNSLYKFDALDFVLKIAITNNNKRGVSESVRMALNSPGFKYVFAGGLPFAVFSKWKDDDTIDLNPIFNNDACLTFDSRLSIPRNPYTSARLFEEWLNRNNFDTETKQRSLNYSRQLIDRIVHGNIVGNLQTSMRDLETQFDKLGLKWDQNVRMYSDGSYAAKVTRHDFARLVGYFDKDFGENLMYVVKRRSENYVEFGVFASPSRNSSAGNFIRYEIEDKTGKKYMIPWEGTQVKLQNNLGIMRVFYSGIEVPQGTTFRIRLEFDGTTRLTPWLKA